MLVAKHVKFKRFPRYSGEEHAFSTTCRDMVKKCEELLKEVK
jgi:hypothetical protein